MRSLLLVLNGGFDTVSHILTSIIYFLHKYPNERLKIHEEIMNTI